MMTLNANLLPTVIPKPILKLLFSIIPEGYTIIKSEINIPNETTATSSTDNHIAIEEAEQGIPR